MTVSAVPEGFATISVYLVVPDAREALDFYARAFGGEPGSVMEGPGGGVLHAEMRLGDSTLMLTSENPEWHQKAPHTVGGISSSVHLYVEDVDAAFQRAVDAGCEVTHPIMDMFWGDRFGKLVDPYGHAWGLATHVEDVSDEEMGERASAFFASIEEGGG